MNPFDLPGPQFLIFYSVWGIIILVFLHWYLGTKENENTGHIRVVPSSVTDPYQIAYLRGGKNEALRVAVISLIDRGLLKVKDETNLVAEKHAEVSLVKRKIEKDILSWFKTEKTALSIYDCPYLDFVCDAYQHELEKEAFLPNSVTRSARNTSLVIAIGILLGVSVIKIAVAISRGRYNISYLIWLTVAFAILSIKIANRKRTRRGNKFLKDVQSYFTSLKARAGTMVPGGATNELALLAAIFGLGAVSATAYPYVKKLYPKAYSTGQGGRGVFGSGCGTSCSSSCGSSCGGGGGGCGGCGG